MTPQSLGLRTDLMVMAGESVVEPGDGHIVVRTPGEPTYWFGNFVAFSDPVPSAKAMLLAFAEAFPDAAHVCLRFDDPDGRIGPEIAALAEAGLELEIDDTLVNTGDLPVPPVPDGYALRPIAGDTDWGQVVDLQHRTGIEQGHGSGADHRAYVETRFARVRAQVEAGRGRWFGAFEGDTLAADLGVYLGDGLGRYQNVETDPAHRRRGICAALVCHAGRWARQIAGADLPLVIVAEAEGGPGCIYRRCGFAPAERLISALRPGYSDGRSAAVT